MSKNNFGLDLGTASAGWCLAKVDDNNPENNSIIDSGVNIFALPGKYDKTGTTFTSNAAARTSNRSVRKLIQRKNLRRERLHRVFNKLNMLPNHYSDKIDFVNKLGQFKISKVYSDNKKEYYEPRIQWGDNGEKIFIDSYNEMCAEFDKHGLEHKNYNNVIYYLRKKATKEKISLEEISYIILTMNQKRGFTFDLENDGKYVAYDKILEATKSLEKIDYSGQINGTENAIKNSGLHVGEFIYSKILGGTELKLKGDIIKGISRHFYIDEVEAILRMQIPFYPEVFTYTNLVNVVNELYRSNVSKRNSLLKNAESNLVEAYINFISSDILFYNRPLKSQRHLIKKCHLEYNLDKDGNKRYRVVANSNNPISTEFRILNVINNIRISIGDDDCTNLITNNVKKQLLDKLVKQDSMLYSELGEEISNLLGIEVKISNYSNSRKFKANEFIGILDNALASVIKSNDIRRDFIEDNYVKIFKLKQIEDQEEFNRALVNFSNDNGLNIISFRKAMVNLSVGIDYLSYSEKAIKTMMELMVPGAIIKNKKTIKRINSIINYLQTGEVDDSISSETIDNIEKYFKGTDFNTLSIDSFNALPEHIAKYVCYNFHSNVQENVRYTYEDFKKYIASISNDEIRNPIVKNSIMKVFRLVADSWKEHGKMKDGFFDTFIIEVNRDLRLSGKVKKEYDKNSKNNEHVNIFISKLARKFSKTHTFNAAKKRIKVYLETLADIEKKNNIFELINKRPYDVFEDYVAKSNIISFYTGQDIAFSDIFENKYDIEHIIPQSIWYDNTSNNTILVERTVNGTKSNMFGMEFIESYGGTQCGEYTILTKSEYIALCNKYFIMEVTKGKKTKTVTKPKYEVFMATEISGLTSRTMNDTSYINSFVVYALSKIVRTKDDNNVKSKNVILSNGIVTNKLNGDWGVSEINKKLSIDRFREQGLVDIDVNGNEIIPTQNGKIRVDYRHHALDAMILAFTTNDLVDLILTKNRNTPRIDKLKKKHIGSDKRIMLPYSSFKDDVSKTVSQIIPVRVGNKKPIGKSRNKNFKIIDGVKTLVYGKSFKYPNNQLHNDGVYKKTTRVTINENGERVIDDVFAKRKSLVGLTASNISNINCLNIQMILRNYLTKNNLVEETAIGNSKFEFKSSHVVDLNTNIELYNNGVKRKPILSISIAEGGNSKKPLYIRYGKPCNYVENAKGSLVYYLVKDGKASGVSLSIYDIFNMDKKHNYKWTLKPNDYILYGDENTEWDMDKLIRVNNFSSSEVKFTLPHIAISVGKEKDTYNTFKNMNNIAKNHRKIKLNNLGKIINI